MSLVRVLPSFDDEVNVAAFHPHGGCGLVYGTKEGRLRILRHDRRPPPPEDALTLPPHVAAPQAARAARSADAEMQARIGAERRGGWREGRRGTADS